MLRWRTTAMGGLLSMVLVAACGAPTPTAAPTTGEVPETLPNELFAAHYVDSYPKHGDVFAQAPQTVQIDFNFTLHETSSITLTRLGAPVEVGVVTFGPRNLSMSVALPAGSEDGVYLVEYRACWPDRSCHDGQFVFTVNGGLRETYLDLTGGSTVQVGMENLRFRPAAIVVKQGTMVTWANQDGAVHFVNSDPHPSHNVLAGLNSLDMAQGQTYSYVFSEPGEWGYHCSAHFPQGMTGRVIVTP